MKKVLVITAIIALLLAGIVSCNGAVDERLWGSKEEIKPKTHENFYTIQSDGSWKGKDGKILEGTGSPYITVVVDNQPTEIIDLTKDISANVGAGKVVVRGKDISYTNTSGRAQEVVLKTGNYEINVIVNCPSDTVRHYGIAGSVDLIAVASSSYHEWGRVPFIEVSKGRIVLEDDSMVKQVHISTQVTNVDSNGNKTKTPDVFENILIDISKVQEMPIFSRDKISPEALHSAGNEGLLVVTVETQSDTEKVFLLKEGIYEQIKVAKVEKNITGAQVFVDTSLVAQDVKNVASQIANNIGGIKDTDYKIETDTREIQVVIGHESIAVVVDVGKTENEKKEEREKVVSEALQEEKGLNSSFGFYNSFQDDDGNWHHQIKTAQQFRNIGVIHYNDEIPKDAKDSTAVYEIIEDLDFGGVSPWWDNTNECYYDLTEKGENKTIGDFVFTGRLEGNNHTLSNALVTEKMGQKVSSDECDVGGLFDAVYNAKFNNFTVKEIVIRNSSAKPGAIIACGYSNSIGTEYPAKEGYIEFNNVHVDATCSILESKQGVSSFLGYARNINKISFNGCTNNAKIIATGQNVGSFIGSLTGGHESICFMNCSNTGNLTAEGLIGAFYGSDANSDTIVKFINCNNSGNITVTQYGTCGVFCGSYHDIGKFTFENCKNTGYIYANDPTKVKNTNKEFTNNLWTSADEAKNYVLSSSIKLVEVVFGQDFSIVVTNLNSVEYDRATLSITLGAIDKFYLENSMMFSSGGDVVKSEEVHDIGLFTSKQLTRAGWFAPTETTVTGAFQGYPPTHSSASWYEYYKIDWSKKGTAGYEDGYHEDEQGSYYIIANDNRSYDYSQIMNGHTNITYTVTLYKNDEIVAQGQNVSYWAPVGTDNEVLKPLGK